jgi:hypothetical protein
MAPVQLPKYFQNIQDLFDKISGVDEALSPAHERAARRKPEDGGSGDATGLRLFLAPRHDSRHDHREPLPEGCMTFFTDGGSAAAGFADMGTSAPYQSACAAVPARGGRDCVGG